MWIFVQENARKREQIVVTVFWAQCPMYKMYETCSNPILILKFDRTPWLDIYIRFPLKPNEFLLKTSFGTILNRQTWQNAHFSTIKIGFQPLKVPEMNSPANFTSIYVVVIFSGRWFQVDFCWRRDIPLPPPYTPPPRWMAAFKKVDTPIDCLRKYLGSSASPLSWES